VYFLHTNIYNQIITTIHIYEDYNGVFLYFYQVPDYHEIITKPMDLSTVMNRIDEHCYTTPKQWLYDVELITKNALK